MKKPKQQYCSYCTEQINSLLVLAKYSRNKTEYIRLLEEIDLIKEECNPNPNIECYTSEILKE